MVLLIASESKMAALHRASTGATRSNIGFALLEPKKVILLTILMFPSWVSVSVVVKVARALRNAFCAAVDGFHSGTVFGDPGGWSMRTLTLTAAVSGSSFTRTIIFDSSDVA
jgi:hypothetical protein